MRVFERVKNSSVFFITILLGAICFTIVTLGGTFPIVDYLSMPSFIIFGAWLVLITIVGVGSAIKEARED